MDYAAKYRIYPTPEQRKIISRNFGSRRYVWNQFLEKINNHINENDSSIDEDKAYCDELISNYPYYLELLLQNNPWLKEVNKIILEESIRDLLDLYSKRIQAQRYQKKYKNQRKPQLYFRRKKGKQTYRIKGNITVTPTNIYLPDLGEVRLPKLKHKENKSEQSERKKRIKEDEIQYATVSLTETGNYYVSINCHNDKTIPLKQLYKENVVGIDLGLEDLVVTSNGEKYKNPKFLYKQSKRIHTIKSQIKQKKSGSDEQKILKKKLAKVREHVANQRRDFLHKLSREIVNQYDIIAMETLNTKGMIEKEKTEKAKERRKYQIKDAGWRSLQWMIKYKTQNEGKGFVRTDENLRTTQICSNCWHACGPTNEEERAWECEKCHAHHDRDINAAKNIKYYGLKKFKRENRAIRIW